MTLLEMSFTGGILILAITVIRFLSINRLPKRVFLLLWEIAIFKLLIPFSIPSMFSIYTLFKRKQSLVIQQNVTPFIAPTHVAEPIATTLTVQKTISIWQIVWLVGLFICLIGFISAYIICYKRFRYMKNVKNGFIVKWVQEQNLKRNVKVRLSDTISSPLTYGIFKPIILLPTTIDKTPIHQLTYILTHEMVHIKRFDNLRKIIAGIVVCIHWFNPMVWLLYILFNRDIELVCDETVIHSTNKDCRSTYAMTLIAMEENKKEVISIYSHFGKNAIEERIVAIMKIKKLNVLTAGIASALVFGVTSVFATSANDIYTYTVSTNDTNAQKIVTAIKNENNVSIEIIDNSYSKKEVLDKFSQFGISFDKNDKMLFNGELVRYFCDGTDIEGNLAIQYTYLNQDGVVDIYTKYESTSNKDGGYNPFGKLISLEKLSQEDFDNRIFSCISSYMSNGETKQAIVMFEEDSAISYKTGEVTDVITVAQTPTNEVKLYTDANETITLRKDDSTEWIKSDDAFAVQIDDEEYTFVTSDEIQEYALKGIAQGDTIVINNGTQYSISKSDMNSETVTENIAISLFNAENTNAGQTLSEKFVQYKPYGITYKTEADNSSGNVYYKGELVNTFVDITPNGGTFTYTSKDSSTTNSKVVTVYDNNGKLCNVKEIKAS